MSSILHITLLASEWKSSKGGLSTINRELAIQLAKQPNVSVSFLVPEYSENDKEAAYRYGINVIKAEMLTGYEGVERLVSPPESLLIDFVVGHGVVLGKQAQIIRRLHNCKWVQVVHNAPHELAMFKSYPGAISKGDEKQRNELSLCEKADLVIATGPKLKEFYSAYLNQQGKRVYNLTPGIFHNLSSIRVSCQTGAKFRILVFGRGDKEDFAIKGYDIAAQAIAKLADKSYHLTFVGASSESENQLIDKLLEQGLDRSQLIVIGYQEDRDFLEAIMRASNLVLIPSRTEGFGLTALEALSAGLPFLVSQNSGFGEALRGIGTSFVVDSEDPNHWAEAIRRIRERVSEKAIQECQQLRTRYAEKYSWEKQCRKFVEILQSLPHKGPSINCQIDNFASLTPSGTSAYQQDVRLTDQFPSSSSTNQSSLTAKGAPLSLSKRKVPQVPNEKQFKATKLESPPSVSSIIASLEGSSTSLFPERPQENLRTMQDSSETTQHVASNETPITAALALLSCNVPATSLYAVDHVLEIIGNTVTFVTTRLKGTSPTQVRDYLERENLPRICLLLVDADEVNRACRYSLLEELEYKDLFKTVLDRVAEKVVIVVCANGQFSQENEVQLFIEGVVEKREKGFIVWLKDGALSVDPDTLAHILIPGQLSTQVSPKRSCPKMPRGVAASASATITRPINVDEREGCPPFFTLADLLSRDVSLHPALGIQAHQEKHSSSNSTSTDSYELIDEAINSAEQGILTAQEPVSTPVTKSTRDTWSQESSKTVLDWRKLEHGRISDVVVVEQPLPHLIPGLFRTRLERLEPQIPEEVEQDLLKQFGTTPKVEVKVVSNQGVLKWFAEENSREAKEIAENEALMLKTGVRYGQVSMEKNDLQFRYPEWTVPECILQKIESGHRDMPRGELNIISDEKGNLRFHVSYSHEQETLARLLPLLGRAYGGFPFPGFQ